MRRFLITLITVVTLAGTFRVYSAVVLPLTEVQQSEHPLVDPLETQIRAPAIFEQQAVKVFHEPRASWTHRAEQTWQLAESAYLYFNSFVRVPGSGNSIQISPVAIFWEDPKRPDAPPFRVLAERAQIKFQNSFFDSAISMSNANPGRIVWASLEGAVYIDGPDGLRIVGQNFKFEEESLQLYSDHEVSFAYGPTPEDQRQIDGTADQLKLTFEPSHESILGKDMPRIGGLDQVLLRRNVVLDARFVQQGESRAVQIRSAGPLLYDAPKREVTLDDRVRVVHISDPAIGVRKDVIECNWMQLQFEQAAKETSEKKRTSVAAFDGLVFQRMRAQGSENGHGSQLKITSYDHQIAAKMQDLSYDAAKRCAVLIDQQQVVIHRGNMKFACPQIALQHSTTNQLEHLECRGPGQMDVLQEDPQAPPAITRWQSGVLVEPDPQAGVHRIEVQGQARMGVPGQFGVAANTIYLWVDLERVPQQPGAKQRQASQNLLASVLPLKRARAESNVRLDSPMLKVERCQLIDMQIHPGLIETAMQAAVGSRGEGGQERERQNNPWIVSADKLHVKLVHDSGKALIDFREINGIGRIKMEYDPGEATVVGKQQIEGILQLNGDTFVAQNAGGVKQVVTVRGEVGPQGEVIQNASIALGQAALWGSHITLSRHENRVDVLGPGKLTTPLPQTLNGQPTGGGAKLDVVWNEGMAFDGKAARFWGKVTTTVPGEQKSLGRLLCEDLTATLNQKISFVDSSAMKQDLTISEVAGSHQVFMESVEYQENRLAAVRRSNVSSFKVDLQSGEFKGEGPGIIHSWSLGDTVKFAPGETPRANQPVRSSENNKWRYANIRFSGAIVGNFNRNDATLHERVEVLTAPVDNALAVFQRDQLSNTTPEAENAAWMKCKQMRIVQKQGSVPAEKHYEVFAMGDTELEGHVFRAVADELTFDEWKGEFTLRGLGRPAELYHQPNPGEPVSPSSALMIRFIPAKSFISVDGSTGISGSY